MTRFFGRAEGDIYGLAAMEGYAADILVAVKKTKMSTLNTKRSLRRTRLASEELVR